MKIVYRNAVIVIFVVIIATATTILWPLLRYGRLVKQQEKVGQRFMQSLSEKDLDGWVHWADEKMSCYERDHKADCVSIANKDLPMELRRINVLRLDMSTNIITLVWVGGMGNTSLQFRKERDGTMRVVAWYTDESSRELYCK